MIAQKRAESLGYDQCSHQFSLKGGQNNMLKINLINIDTNKTVATWESRKKKLSAIQKEASDKLSEVTVGHVFSQGTIKYLDQAPEIPYFQKGSTMWWVSKTGHFQYEIVSQ